MLFLSVLMSTIFQDLDSNIDVALPTAPEHLRETPRAELLLDDELILWENPTIQQMVDILDVWFFLVQETRKGIFR